jgi:hypothetical protein
MRFGRAHPRVGAAAVVVSAFVLLAACSGARSDEKQLDAVGSTTSGSSAGGSASSSASGSPSTEPGTTGPGTTAAPGQDFSVPDPGPFDDTLLTADVLITSTETIPASVRRRISGLRGVQEAMPFSLASLSSNGRTLTIASVDPGEYRRFTRIEVAQADEVWSRVAGGEVAVDPSVGKKLEEPKGYLTLGTQEDAPEVHIGAYAPMVKSISAVVARPRGDQMGMPQANALLVSTGKLTPSVLTGKMKRIIGKHATLQVLALEFDVDIPQTAVLTGTTAAEAVGSFSYTARPDGRIVPDARWVAANIRTETVPLLGSVTCHRVMIPQLRSALEEIIARGLADKIHPDEYAGCYYPRYIGYDPAKGLSLHSWGIAVDLNVPGNQRGTVGQMDRQVVQIFKKWGFAWGGDWNYTDPMHFELASIVKPG